jgi:hypothetical protein
VRECESVLRLSSLNIYYTEFAVCCPKAWRLKHTELHFYLLFCMGVKLDLLYYGQNTDWQCLRRFWEQLCAWSSRRMEKITQWRASWFLLLIKDYWGGQIKEGEMGGVCNTHVGTEKCMRNFGKNTWREIQTGRSSCRLEDTTDVPSGIECDVVE